jgi:predicted nuclease with TOPRIM domain
MSNRTDRRDKKQLEQYKKTCEELSKLKQDYKDLTHQCAEADDKNHKLTEENTKLADLVKTMCDEVKKLQDQLALHTQAAEHAKLQGLKEIGHEEHLCGPSAEDPGVCDCGKPLPILDLAKALS